MFRSIGLPELLVILIVVVCCLTALIGFELG
jgi:Sec-independent protein translocase protein TatA